MIHLTKQLGEETDHVIYLEQPFTSHQRNGDTICQKPCPGYIGRTRSFEKIRVSLLRFFFRTQKNITEMDDRRN